MNNWKTTVAGIVLAASTYAQQAGIHVGHLGNTDFVTAIGSVAALLLGFYAKDKAPGDTTGQNVGQKWFVVTPDLTPTTG